jgi:hypothetical protein
VRIIVGFVLSGNPAQLPSHGSSGDVLRARDAWKGRWNTTCEYVRALSRNYASEQMSRWLTHWDYQLYKALEAGYRMGLESLNENLGEIKTELIYAPGAKSIQVRPRPTCGSA